MFWLAGVYIGKFQIVYMSITITGLFEKIQFLLPRVFSPGPLPWQFFVMPIILKPLNSPK